jgi:DNA polymerase III subunit epsilon
MAAWRNQPMCGVDFETTGVSVENDRIVTGCVATLQPAAAGPWNVNVRSWLVDPGIDIPEEATAVHGVTTAHAKEHGQPAPEAVDLIAGEVALSVRARLPLVGMNPVYDLTLLDRECRRHDLPTVEERVGAPIAPVIDIYCIDKALDKYRPGKRKLTDLCELYGARIDGAHDSSFDALAAVRVAWRMALRAEQDAATLRGLYAARKFPDRLVKDWQAFGRMDLAALHAAQVRWFAEQAKDFAKYLQQQANEARHRAEVAAEDARLAAAAVAEATDEAAAAEAAEERARAETAQSVAEQEAAELDARVDAMSSDWPVKPLTSGDVP